MSNVLSPERRAIVFQGELIRPQEIGVFMRCNRKELDAFKKFRLPNKGDPTPSMFSCPVCNTPMRMFENAHLVVHDGLFIFVHPNDRVPEHMAGASVVNFSQMEDDQIHALRQMLMNQIRDHSKHLSDLREQMNSGLTATRLRSNNVKTQKDDAPEVRSVYRRIPRGLLY